MYIVSKYKIYSHKFKKQEEKQEQVSVSVSRRVLINSSIYTQKGKNIGHFAWISNWVSTAGSLIIQCLVFHSIYDRGYQI